MEPKIEVSQREISHLGAQRTVNWEPWAGQESNRSRAGKFLSVQIVPVRESEPGHSVKILLLEREKYFQSKPKFRFHGCDQGAECAAPSAGTSLKTSRMDLVQKPLHLRVVLYPPVSAQSTPRLPELHFSLREMGILFVVQIPLEPRSCKMIFMEWVHLVLCLLSLGSRCLML